MPRQARIDAPGALHHIICRGIDRKRIFVDDQDRDSFLVRLGNVLLKTSTSCFAWALVPNHFHLLLSTGTSPIASVMERLLTGYAGDFNRRHHRHGHLFQNRYKSILCQTDPYLLEPVRYIHLNPLRAGLVKSVQELDCFAYSGHSGIGKGNPQPWQAAAEVLSRFDKNVSLARQQYQLFIADGIGMGKRPDLVGGGLLRSSGGWEKISLARHFGEYLKGDERILGDSDFVDEVLGMAQEQYEKETLCSVKGMDLNWLAQRVAGMLQIEPSEIWKEGKMAKTVQGRSLLCYWAIRELRMTAEAVSKQVNLTESGVVRAAQRGERLVASNGWRLS